jgi:hypothetical protein
VNNCVPTGIWKGWHVARTLVVMNDGQYSSQVFSDKVAFGFLVDWTTRV